RRAGDAVRIDQAERAFRERHLDDGLVLAADGRVDAARLEEDALDVARQEPKRVEKVDERLVHEEARHFAEIRLHGVRFRSDAIARAPLEGELKEPAKASAVDEAPRLAVPRLPAPVLVDEEPYACGLAVLDHAERVVPRVGHWLLADDMEAFFRRHAGKGPVWRGPCGDVDEVEVVRGEHLIDGLVRGRYAPASGEVARLARRGARDRDARCSGGAPPP